ncbi:hypothetical protein ACX12M_15575 [Cellulosimicrobium cellulans]|uniref:Uncharacterized protein n=1 Tax=Cellulosimicrobium funkei TaxID=264251 RepID=A0A4Y8R6K8_9MICO|nr:hypothetical protein [Cellulosimicrobium funkei]TFF16824.1 hypothetical protein E1O70_05630 [Cellulosimicrobium funkei]TGA78346.1 hypothetical protein EQW79_000260 [Cellulosimicrobium terreum]
MTSTAATGTRADVRAASQDGPGGEPDDVRDVVGVGVLMPNGRLAGRSFASRAEAEAWARPEEGEQVVELNVLCDCDL